MSTKTFQRVRVTVLHVAQLGAALCMTLLTTGAAAAGEPTARAWSGGGDVRLRDEYSDGAATLSRAAPLHAQNYLRLRTRAWGTWAPAENVAVRARLVAEPRYWTQTSSAKTFAGRTGTEERFALLDELAIEWKTRVGAAGDPLIITVGRQELKFGETGNGWLVNEGTPGDGSWTAYFDAARAMFKSAALNTTFDCVVIDQDSDADDRLPTLGRSDAYAMSEHDEFGAIVYATHRVSSAAQVDAFVIYKENRRVLANGNDSELTTPGVRLSGEFATRWQYNTELAYQFGEKRDPTVRTPVSATQRRDVRAWGGNAKLTWLARDARENRLSLIGEYLSGDDSATSGRDEMFDVLWGRCPRFSDLVATAFTVENGATYQAANLVRIGPEWNCAPTKTSGFTLGWQRLIAPESTPTRAAKPATFSRSGNVRGDYFRAMWRQRFTKTVSGFVMAEALKQGDFYARRDTLRFLRIELAVTF